MATKKAPESAPPSTSHPFLVWIRSLGIQRIPKRIGDATSRIAARFGIHPFIVRGVIAATVALVVVLTLVVVSAVAQTSTPTAAPSPVPSSSRNYPTPKPTASPAVSIELAPDERCRQMFDPAEVASALGVSTDLRRATAEPLLALVGGFGCGYGLGEEPNGSATGQPTDGGDVDVSVAPRAIADPAVVEASLRSVHCYQVVFAPASLGDDTCTATVADGDWWYTLTVQSYASAGAPLARFDAIAQQLESTLDATVPPAPARVVGSFDCAHLTAAGFAAVATGRELSVGDSEVTTAASLLAAPSRCLVDTQDDQRWSLAVFPGGAEAYGPCTRPQYQSGSPIDVPGVQAAFAFEGGAQLCATDGESTVRVSRFAPPGHGGAQVWDSQSLETLSSLLTAVFAAPIPSTSAFKAFTSAGSPPHTVPPLAGGDCRALLDAPAMAALAEGSPDQTVNAGDALLAVVGGIDCVYLFGDFNTHVTGSVEVAIAPSAIVDPNVLRATLTPAECSTRDGGGWNGQGCRVTATTGGWWYTLVVKTEQSASEQEATFMTIISMLEEALNRVESPGRLDVAVPFDCDSRGLPWSGSRRPFGRQASEIYTAAFLLAGPASCRYRTAEGDWDLEIYAGGAGAYSQCIQFDFDRDPSTGRSISVPGVAYAYHADDSNLGFTRICASDGISTVVILPWALDGKNSLKIDDAMLAALGSLLVPVFAAAD